MHMETDINIEPASMEPRSAERGDPFPLRRVTRARVASMEPRSAERGNASAGFWARERSARFNGATLS